MRAVGGEAALGQDLLDRNLHPRMILGLNG
jgi:hypothetical protein